MSARTGDLTMGSPIAAAEADSTQGPEQDWLLS